MTRLTLEELRQAATQKAPSLNNHLASAWELRWYDPLFIAAWERWQKAREAWRRTELGVPWAGQSDPTYNPDPSLIADRTAAAVAIEFLLAREEYKSIANLYKEEET